MQNKWVIKVNIENANNIKDTYYMKQFFFILDNKANGQLKLGLHYTGPLVITKSYMRKFDI